MLQLSQLYRYPLKSGAAELLRCAWIDALGVQGDRRWMVVDEQNGRFLTQRLLPALGRIVARWQGEQLLLSAPGCADLLVRVTDHAAARRIVQVWRDTPQVVDAGEAAAHWLSCLLQRPCRLVQITEETARQVDLQYARPGERVGFADGFPLLLIGEASLQALSDEVGRPLEMLRFRPNLVVSGSPAYAEEGWQRIAIGELTFRLVKPCGRCVMTTLDPQTGERSADNEPLATLKRLRQHNGEALFGQNLIAEGCGELRLGMPVRVLQ